MAYTVLRTFLSYVCAQIGRAGQLVTTIILQFHTQKQYQNRSYVQNFNSFVVTSGLHSQVVHIHNRGTFLSESKQIIKDGKISQIVNGMQKKRLLESYLAIKVKDLFLYILLIL